VIVRWGLDELGSALVDTGVGRPLLVASRRWADLELPVPVQGTWSQVPTHDIGEVAREAAGCDGVLALGGGSAIDLGKALSAETGLPLVSVPTTYSGAEWTRSFGIRDEARRMRGGGSGSHNAGIVYDVDLTLGLPHAETAGTALNALDHCAEALYVVGRNEAADREALAGAAAISTWLPRVLERPDDREARTELLRGAAHAGAALAGAGLGLAHAMAQAAGGRYGLPHGAMNALCLPPVLRFNAEVARDAIARLAAAMEVEDAAEHAHHLARLGGFHRLRDFDVPADELADLAETAADRPGNRANPRVATPAEIRELYASIW
jgi:alcohol dehydrogenase class IV